MSRSVRGALRSTIFAHGPIDVENVESAVKRIVGDLKNVGVTYDE